jgi:hypothetical protein
LATLAAKNTATVVQMARRIVVMKREKAIEATSNIRFCSTSR